MSHCIITGTNGVVAYSSVNDSDLADGLLTIKAIQSRQKSPPGSPAEADLAEPTSPWSSAAYVTHSKPTLHAACACVCYHAVSLLCLSWSVVLSEWYSEMTALV